MSGRAPWALGNTSSGHVAVSTLCCISRLAFPIGQIALEGGREEGSFQRPSELPCVLLQLLSLGLEVCQGLRAREIEHGVLGGQGHVLEQAAEMAAATEDLVAHVPVLGLSAQRVYQLLSYHDDQLALRDEDLRRLSVAEAAVEDADGFEERPEIQAAVLRKVDLLLGVLLTQGLGHRVTFTLEKQEKTVGKRGIPSTGCAWLPFPVFAPFGRLLKRKGAILLGKPIV